MKMTVFCDVLYILVEILLMEQALSTTETSINLYEHIESNIAEDSSLHIGSVVYN
jgi:hypothetical protein